MFSAAELVKQTTIINMNIRFLVFSGLLLLLWSSCARVDEKDNKDQPNFLFILTDDQERDEFNFLSEGKNEDGTSKNLCPAIDKLAQEGVIFSGLHCPSPLCVPSRFNYLTGQYASRATNHWFTDLHKLHAHTFVAQEPKLTPDVPTLAKQLKSLGYKTGFVGKDHTLEVDGWHKLAVDADVTSESSVKQLQKNDSLLEAAFHKMGFDFADRIYHTNPKAHGPAAISVHNMDWITEGAFEFLDNLDDEPFYLVYSTTVPHGPHNGWKTDPRATPSGILDEDPDIGVDRSTIPTRLKEKNIHPGKGDILWLDDNILALIDKLKKKGIYENTIIVYVSDHGVESGKTTAYEGGMSTTGFITGPGIRKGVQNASLTSTVDLVPTIMDMAGGNPKDYPYDGLSLLPILSGKKEKIRESVYGEMGHSRAVIKGKYKYIALRYSDYTRNMSVSERQAWLDAMTKYMHAIGREPFDNNINGPFGHSGHIPGGWDNEWGAMNKYPAYFDADQLYNLEEDPNEQDNLAYKSEYQDVLREMKAELSKYIEKLPGGFAEFKEDEYRDLPEDSVLEAARRLRKDVFH